MNLSPYGSQRDDGTVECIRLRLRLFSHGDMPKEKKNNKMQRRSLLLHISAITFSHSSPISPKDLSIWQHMHTKCMHMWCYACRKCIFMSAPNLSVIRQRWSNVSRSQQKLDVVLLGLVSFSVSFFLKIGSQTPASCCFSLFLPLRTNQSPVDNIILRRRDIRKALDNKQSGRKGKK